MNVVVFCVVVAVLLIFDVNGADRKSPCPNVFKYEEQTATDRWQGLIEIKSNGEIEGIWLNLVLDSKADVLINTFGETTTLDNKKFLIKRPDFTLPVREILKVRFTVKYNIEKPVPNLVAIILNGVEICAIPSEPTPTRTIVPDAITISSTSATLGDRRPFTQQNVKCGMKNQAQTLIRNGWKADELWPWHVAIMFLKNGKLEYSCGGTLISDRHVLTAAHCVTILGTKKLLENNQLILYLGLTKLVEDLGTSLVLRLVADINVHNEYNPTSFHNDIALIKLSELVEFNSFVWPICLWDGDLEIRNMVGQFGTVVGWGIDDTNKTAVDLMEAKLPIVGLETCLYHDRNFYSQFTSLKTFCAGGGGSGATVCRGDSGGGLIFPKPGTTGKDTVWHIRGIVSVSPRDSEGICNTNSYAVFTDVAQHLTWIKQTANLK